MAVYVRVDKLWLLLVLSSSALCGFRDFCGGSGGAAGERIPSADAADVTGPKTVDGFEILSITSDVFELFRVLATGE